MNKEDGKDQTRNRHGLCSEQLKMRYDTSLKTTPFNGLVQDCSKSSALAMELLQSDTHRSIGHV